MCPITFQEFKDDTLLYLAEELEFLTTPQAEGASLDRDVVHLPGIIKAYMKRVEHATSTEEVEKIINEYEGIA